MFGSSRLSIAVKALAALAVGGLVGFTLSVWFEATPDAQSGSVAPASVAPVIAEAQPAAAVRPATFDLASLTPEMLNDRITARIGAERSALRARLDATATRILRDDPAFDFEAAMVADVLAEKQGCLAGDAAACTALGLRYDAGTGTLQDVEATRALFFRACEGQDEEGCTQLYYASDRFDLPEVMRHPYYDFFQAGCDAGNAAHCAQIVDRFLISRKSHLEAIGVDMVSRVCDAGPTEPCAEMSSYLPNIGERRAIASATCEAGVASGCYKLSWIERSGCADDAERRCVHRQGIKAGPEGIARSLPWLKKACTLDPEGGACANYGKALAESGDGAGALAFLDASCDGGSKSACKQLAAMFEKGEHTPRDLARALALLKGTCTPTAKKPKCYGVERISNLMLRANPAPLAALVAEAKLPEATTPEEAKRLRSGCTGGDMDVCTDLADLLAKDKPMQTTAFILAGKACDSGKGRACVLQSGLQWKLDSRDAREPANKRLLDTCNTGYMPACAKLLPYDRKGKKQPPYDVAIITTACTKDDLHGCHLLARHHESGWGVPKDKDAARKLHDRACDGGHASACAANAYLLRTQEEGNPIDTPLVSEYWHKGCDLGDETSCWHLGYDYASGDGVARDPALALSFFERSCPDDTGSGSNCSSLRALRMSFGREKLQEREGVIGALLSDERPLEFQDVWRGAARRLRRWCREDGTGGSCRDLAGLYGDSEVLRDYAGDPTHVALLEDLCDKDDGPACAALGNLNLYTEDGVAADAHAYLDRACGLGVGASCHQLAGRYDKYDDATVLSKEDALAYLEKACGLGIGCDDFDSLREVEPDVQTALSRDIDECLDGGYYQCDDVAKAYRRGEGVPRKPALADAFTGLGCALGYEETCAHPAPAALRYP